MTEEELIQKTVSNFKKLGINMVRKEIRAIKMGVSMMY